MQVGGSVSLGREFVGGERRAYDLSGVSHVE